ncbi:Uncharacterised protein [Mycobacteroides abscessus subsp. abscessus]|nr:Uncharacterised protein [Mycobacteroides abscessus subsp. abscessus]
MLARRDVHQRAEVIGVLRDVSQVDALAARPAMAAVIQGVHQVSGLVESPGHVVVPARVFTESVGKHHHRARRSRRCPGVIDDPHIIGTVEGALHPARCSSLTLIARSAHAGNSTEPSNRPTSTRTRSSVCAWDSSSPRCPSSMSPNGARALAPRRSVRWPGTGRRWALARPWPCTCSMC